MDLEERTFKNSNIPSMVEVIKFVSDLPQEHFAEAHQFMNEKLSDHRRQTGSFRNITDHYFPMMEDRYAEVLECLKQQYGHLIGYKGKKKE